MYDHKQIRRTCIALVLFAAFTSVATKAAEPIRLHAGPLSMVFEPDNAFLRYIKLDSDEVLRGISAPVRNQFWGTVRPQVKIVSLEQSDHAFTLKFDATCRERDIDFLWHGTIRGSADGKLEYTFDGQARSDFQRNRIGFCVLHGESSAGRPWVLENTRGEKSKGRFPELIAPHQPAKDLRAVAHEFAKGRWARVVFDGDVFEMEDQRNWTDASFKTYCTPLELPFPVQLTKGTRVQQKITLTLDGDIPKVVREPEKEPIIALTVGKEVSDLPGIGVQVSSQTPELTATEIALLKALQLNHLRVDLTPANEDASSQLRNASDQANALGTKLIVALHLGNAPDAELKRLRADSESIKPQVATWLVIATDSDTFGKALDALKPLFPTALIGTGEDTNFTELNRKRPDWKGLEVVSYGLNPQVHAIDNRSMIETLPIQGDTVRSARQFVGQLPIVISPVTLRVQLLAQQPLPGELPENVDPRQPSLFAAGWTLGSIKYLSEASVNHITYYETIGLKGVTAGNRQLETTSKFPASPGDVYPMYHVLHAVGDFASGRVQQVQSSDPASVVALALKKNGKERTLVANLTDQAQTIAVQGIDGKVSIAMLDTGDGAKSPAGKQTVWQTQSTAPVSADAPLRLAPYGIAKLDATVE